jgi:predicted MFS family arabinose efflux permease
VNHAELLLIGKPAFSPTASHPSIPWGNVLTSPAVMLLATIMTCGSFNSYIFFSWFPKYLQSGREMPPQAAGFLASLVLAGAAVGTFSGGFATDAILRYCPRRMLCRRLWGFTAYCLAAICLGTAVLCESPYATAGLAAASTLAAHLTIPNWWSCSIEISGRHIGALFGLMNGLGVFGAMGSQFLFGFFADWRKGQGFTGRAQWDPAFHIAAGVLCIAAVCWLFIDTSRSIDPDHRAAKEDFDP